MMSSSAIIFSLIIAAAIGDSQFPATDSTSNQVASGSAPYPATVPLPAPVPFPAKWEHDADQTISLQSGYEGYLVPAEPSLSFTDVLRTAGLITLAPPLGKVAIKFALKFGIWFVGFAALFLLGSLVTSTVCTFTPICTISFIGLGPFSKETARSLLSEERLNSTTKFVMNAFRKYQALNKETGNDNKTITYSAKS